MLWSSIWNDCLFHDTRNHVSKIHRNKPFFHLWTQNNFVFYLSAWLRWSTQDVIVFAERLTPHVLLQNFEVFVSGRNVHEYFGTRPRPCFLSGTGMKALENITSLTAFTQVSPLALSSLCTCFFPLKLASGNTEMMKGVCVFFSLSLLTFIMSLFTFPVYMPEGRAPPRAGDEPLMMQSRSHSLLVLVLHNPLPYWNTMHHFSFQPHCSVAFWQWHAQTFFCLHKGKLVKRAFLIANMQLICMHR